MALAAAEQGKYAQFHEAMFAAGQLGQLPRYPVNLRNVKDGGILQDGDLLLLAFGILLFAHLVENYRHPLLALAHAAAQLAGLVEGQVIRLLVLQHPQQKGVDALVGVLATVVAGGTVGRVPPLLPGRNPVF